MIFIVYYCINKQYFVVKHIKYLKNIVNYPNFVLITLKCLSYTVFHIQNCFVGCVWLCLCLHCDCTVCVCITAVAAFLLSATMFSHLYFHVIVGEISPFHCLILHHHLLLCLLLLLLLLRGNFLCNFF